MSKDGEEEQFRERKTRTSPCEETGRMAEPDGSEEGPLVSGQGVSAEESGDRLGASTGLGAAATWKAKKSTRIDAFQNIGRDR
jgi:hypothetical protein